MRFGWVPLPAPQFPVPRNFCGEARRAPASTSKATARLRSLRALVIPSRRTPQLLAEGLATTGVTHFATALDLGCGTGTEVELAV
jgi:hypothetical protein